MDRFYLDDLTVGQRFVSGTHTMDAAEMQRFAAEFDPQPFHLDDAAAQGTLFGGLVASGWHTAATTMRLIVAGGLPIAGGIVGTGGELLWTSPVRPGDILKVECEILEITPSRSKPDRDGDRPLRHAEPAQRDCAELHAQTRCSAAAGRAGSTLMTLDGAC